MISSSCLLPYPSPELVENLNKIWISHTKLSPQAFPECWPHSSGSVSRYASPSTPSTHPARVNCCALQSLLIYCSGFIIYNLYFHPLCKFPGPLSFAATDIPYADGYIRGTTPMTMKKLHDTYGLVVRVAPNRLSFNDGAAFKDIYGHRQGKLNMQKDMTFYAGP
jgi:hypothetical protein